MSRLDALFSLDARRAFVTGGNSGIGLAMARAIGLAGGSPTLVARREGTRLRASTSLRPSEFGIAPYKALAGAIRRWWS